MQPGGHRFDPGQLHQDCEWDVKRSLFTLAAVLFGVLGVAFAAIARTAVGVFVTHMYRLKTSPMIAFSIGASLSFLSFFAARRLIRRGKAVSSSRIPA